MAMNFQLKGAGTLFKFKVMGEVQAKGMIIGLGDAVKDYTPVWPEVDTIVRADSKAIWDSQGGSRVYWPPLNPTYKRWKGHMGYSTKIMIMTGRLLKAITRSGGEHIFEPHPMFMYFGGKPSYGVYHQSPGRRKRGHRRAFIYISAKIVSRIVGAIRKHVLRSARRG